MKTAAAACGLLEGGTAGQGHYDQWMGYLSDTGLKLDEKVIAEGRAHDRRLHPPD
jgi:hypothetical protein